MLSSLQRVGERGQRLVIVNLQKTPLDGLASLCIHAKCEEVSAILMDKLGLEIPEFRLKRRVLIKQSHDQKANDVLVSIEGQDMYGFSFSFLMAVSRILVNQPFELKLAPRKV